MMLSRSTSLALLAVLFAAPRLVHAAARCELTGPLALLGRVAGSDGLAGELDVRRGDAIDVHLVAPGRLDGKPVLFSDTRAARHVSWSGSGCPEVQIRWRRVEPRMQHVTTPAPNAAIAIYANAVVFGPSHGTWLGYDRIEYFETALPAGDDRWTLTVRDARPSDVTLADARLPEYRDLGTMRLAATVTGPDAVARATPDADDAPRGQIGDDVFRYSVRSGNGLFGWLTSYFNVPYVFGSAGVGARSQAERRVGADCADLIVAGLRRAGRRDLAYSSVGGLVRSLQRLTAPLEVRARGEALEAATYVPRPGDILALDYIGSAELPRPWDHIVVLAVDRSPGGGPADGRLGPDDLVADIGDAQGLKFAPLGAQGDVRVLVLRARGIDS
ncbi:hypothetical protein OV203_06925 [Nannocystis sp. ILAH1]|uniref:hypothetical protein n=1 Tax=Nannocystis sp. ILAH1 TaxID=2996789 RepID=UPI00226DA51C|nr:hypothetical protein [Nannocystis sp. ILAH1]MCY0986847.1 hypothetical protein [Nannocystis sp. ILAH1]